MYILIKLIKFSRINSLSVVDCTGYLMFLNVIKAYIFLNVL